MQLVIDRGGQVRCVYAEDIDLSALGRVELHRASHVEPDAQGQWWADLSPVHGPRLGPYRLRSQALADELRWLESHLIQR
jgi:hypothetical protein